MNEDAVAEELRISHRIKTRPLLRIKDATTIHEKIGNIRSKYRRFMLLDKRKIYVIDKYNGTEPRLIGLKYFNVVTQRLFMVNWIYVHNNNTTIQHLAHFIQDTLLKNECYFVSLRKYLEKMRKMQEKENRLMLFEDGHIFI